MTHMLALEMRVAAVRGYALRGPQTNGRAVQSARRTSWPSFLVLRLAPVRA